MKTIDITTGLTDEVLAEVRRHKREIAEEHGFDVRALARDLQRRQANHPRLVSPQPTANSQQPPAMINPRPAPKLTSEVNSTIIISIHSRPRSGMTCLERYLNIRPIREGEVVFHGVDSVE
jgi:hypothetical protein